MSATTAHLARTLLRRSAIGGTVVAALLATTEAAQARVQVAIKRSDAGFVAKTNAPVRSFTWSVDGTVVAVTGSDLRARSSRAAKSGRRGHVRVSRLPLKARGLTGGRHVVRVKATDARGTTTSASRTVSVARQTTVVRVTVPGASGTLSGKVGGVVATVTGNRSRVSRVALVVDGVTVSTDTGSPWSWSVDTTKLSDGTHRIAATSYEQSGTRTTSDAVTITVKNTITPPPTTTTPPTTTPTTPTTTTPTTTTPTTPTTTTPTTTTPTTPTTTTPPTTTPTTPTTTTPTTPTTTTPTTTTPTTTTPTTTTPTTTTPTTPPTAPAPAWESTFTDFRAWSVYKFPSPGTFFVTQADKAGIAAAPTGDANVAQFEVTAAQKSAGAIHAKLYKGWDVNNARRIDDWGKAFGRMNPGDEAGIYSAWYYLPTDYSMQDSGPLDIFQFKEDTSNDSGATFNGFDSNVQSDLSVWNTRTLKSWSNVTNPSAYNNSLRADYPMLAVSLYHNPEVTPRRGHQRNAMPAPLGRWFKVSAKLYPRDRVEYYIDDTLLDTWYNDEYPVGIRLPNAMGWTFGVGHYGSNVGKLWVSDATFTRFK